MMVESNLRLLLKYPLIASGIQDGVRCYNGILTAEYKDYRVCVCEEKNEGQVNFNLTTKFNDELDGEIAKIKSTNIVVFLDEVVSILKTRQVQSNPINRANIYRRVLCEYSEFVKFHIKMRKSELSADLSSIFALAVDASGREHQVQVRVNFEETHDIYKIHSFHLPEKVSKDLTKPFSNLTEMFGKFLYLIDMLQPLFDAMDHLDKHCCILDPEKPSRRDCYRRIWLDNNLSMLVIVDSTNVTARPDIKFLGPERLVLQYRDKLIENFDEWDENIGLLEGLLNIFELAKFPTKPKSSHGLLMDTGECSICFSLRFNDKLPEVICGNKSCEQFYHVECLYEWLTSVNSKRILNEVCGQCPNCEKRISCPLPEVANAVV